MSSTSSFHFPVSALFTGEDDDILRTLLFALMSSEVDDLDEAIDLINQNPEAWPDSFRYDLEGLREFRAFYSNGLEERSPEEQEMIQRYDDEWAMDLAAQLKEDDSLIEQAEETPTLDPS